MPRKVTVFIAISLDGYIATNDDSLDWLMQTQGEGDNGYDAFLQTVDTIVMGKRTYDWLLREVGHSAYPYQGKQCYVFSRQHQGSDEHVTYTDETPQQFIARLQQQEGGDIWLVGGGGLLQGFIRDGLVDEWIITIAPVLLGDGIPLFGKHDNRTMLELTAVKRFGQFATLYYITKR